MSEFRHGDVTVELVEKLPENRRKAQHAILAHGELTGHVIELLSKMRQCCTTRRTASIFM